LFSSLDEYQGISGFEGVVEIIEILEDPKSIGIGILVQFKHSRRM